MTKVLGPWCVRFYFKTKQTKKKHTLIYLRISNGQVMTLMKTRKLFVKRFTRYMIQCTDAMKGICDAWNLFKIV